MSTRDLRILTAVLAITGWGASCFAQQSQSATPPSPPASEQKAAAAPAANAFPWESNALDAFVKAVEANRPLVVVFTNETPPGESSRSTKCITAIEADGLTEFRDKAFFVNVVLPAKGSPLLDEYGMRMAQQLRLTVVPTVSFIAPNSNRLMEAYRTEGEFPIEEIKKDIQLGIASAMEPKNTWAQPSPKDLVRQFNEAHQLGEADKYAACYAEPLHTAMLNLTRARAAVGLAKRRMLEAIDKQFGDQSDRLKFVDDDEEMKGELREVTGVDLIEATSRDRQVTVRLLFTRLERTGAIKKIEMVVPCVEEGPAWRLSPTNARESAETAARATAALAKLPEDFDRIAQLVTEGKFQTATEARLAAEQAYYARKSASATPQVAGGVTEDAK